MGNKILKIGKETQKTLTDVDDIEDIYRDISTESKPTVKMPSGVAPAEMSRFALDKIVNVDAVQNSLHQIFSWTPGERIILPEFGSKLRMYLYEGITEHNVEQIMAEIRHCVSIWEPRVSIDQVIDVSTPLDVENNTIKLEIVYKIQGIEDKLFSYTYSQQRSVY